MVWERTQQAIQDMVDDAPKAKIYYSDAFDAYDRLWYHFGRYEVSEGKTETFSVEGGTQSCVTTWLVWQENLVVSLVVPMHSIVQSVCSSIVSIADNFTSNASLLTLLMLWSSLAHYVSHSPAADICTNRV